ncbi:GNAT family N-acetyltransferase [Candidatus Bathyarchaeota archaeon]|nr:GNAT family N-acetyltransferase [Candidatus Bathyarchaeota archaeon]
MLNEEPPFLEEAIRVAESKLSIILGTPCKISLQINLDDNLFKIVEQVDSLMFREELRYTKEEIELRVNTNGFILFMAKIQDKTLSLLFGYNDNSIPGGFYLDTLASVIEGKGIGSTLVALLLIYCYETGYSYISLNTEEFDEKKRPLRKFYESIGFQYIYTNQNEGDLMRIQLSPERIIPIYKKFVSTIPNQSHQTPSNQPIN